MKSELQPLATCWEAFYKGVLEGSFTRSEAEVMRAAFYAGAQAVVKCTQQAATELGLHAGMTIADAIHNELKAFETELETKAGAPPGAH